MPKSSLYDSIFKENPIARFTDKYLYPIDSLSESFFSIMIVLIFTLAYRLFSISENTAQSLPTHYSLKIFIASLGAVIAWGIIDGVIYAVLSLFEREETNRFIRDAIAAATEQEKIEVVEEELEDILAPMLEEAQKETVYRAIARGLKTPENKPAELTREDLLAGVSHLIIAVIAVIPSLLPLLVFYNNAATAVRWSTLVSILMLFITGLRWGKYTGTNPLRTGLIISLAAILLALLAILLGG